MATNNLLNQPTPDYRRFVDNQVLTDNQLNGVLDYLNHQDRFTRLLLHGVGIVCGLDISYKKRSNKIRLQNGIAVTTAGDLLYSGEKVFTGFKKFDDANVKYPFFLNDDEQVMPLWALTEDQSPSDVLPLSQFESKTDIKLRDAVALLYLEDFLDEEKDCSAVDCDTQGQSVINRLRVLLISPEDTLSITRQDSLLSGFIPGRREKGIQELQRHFVPRVHLNKANTGSFKEFKKSYFLSFESLAEKIEDLTQFGIFKDALDRADINPVDELLNIEDKPFNFQYCYDFYRDISTAYNELRNALNEKMGICSPHPDAFPKHVLLGEIADQMKVYRHSFYPSPASGSAMLDDVIRMFERILLMIKTYNAENKKEIRITPSKSARYPLGNRAVPFYYNLEKADNIADFFKKWSGSNTDFTLNYHGVNYPDENFDPLDVVFDGHDFYRVEGHTGGNVRDVQKKIQSIRDSKGLSFDIQPVAVGRYPEESLIDFEKYRIYFEDLQVVLEAWNEEQQCLIGTASAFLSGFSVKEPGVHTAYKPEKPQNDNNGNDTVRPGRGEFFGTVFEPVFTPVKYTAITGIQPKERMYGKKKVMESQSIKSLSKVNESAGFALLDKVQPSDSKNDITIKFLDLLPTLTVNWQNDIREATISIPAQIIGHLKEVEDLKLTEIGEFTEENLNGFLRAIHDLSNSAAEAINRLQHMIAKDESKIRGKIWLNDYLHILNRIASSRCLIEKIKVLYETIVERKFELLSGLTLQSFIDKHPGAEHKAGVERGGTLILLYYSRNTGPSKTEQQLLQKMGLMKGTAEERAMKIRHGLTMNERKKLEAVFGKDLMNLNLGDSFIKPFNDDPLQGDVIGDLCLPYVCSSDTPSVTFVFPDQLATLRIPVDHICVNDNGSADLVPLTVLPAGGTVTAFSGGDMLEGVISEKENGLFFIPEKVKREFYGKTIRFEVNGQSVEPTLHVVRKPNARFEISDNVTFENNNTGAVAVILIKNSSVPFDELKFEWKIDGRVVTNEKATEFRHPVKVRPGENVKVDVQLTAFNEYCSDTHQDKIEFRVPGRNEPDNPVEPEDPDNPTDRDKVDLILEKFGRHKIRVIKVVREITGLGLREAKELVESAPVVVLRDITLERAKKFGKELEEAGATVDIKK